MREYTLFEPFCVKVRWAGGSDPRSRVGKSQKVSDSHRNDASPLTRGLNSWFFTTKTPKCNCQKKTCYCYE